ncbi:hypothetical protein Hdeb2414_s0066g00767981 [Helianthus debilis subsp. tardiflorus]
MSVLREVSRINRSQIFVSCGFAQLVWKRGGSIVQGAARICFLDLGYLGSSSIHERVGEVQQSVSCGPNKHGLIGICGMGLDYT